MEDDSGYLRKVITREHNVSRFITLNKLLTELSTLNQCLELGIVPKSHIKDHEKEIADVETCIDRERAHIKAVSEIVDANSERRAPINHKNSRPKYKCIENLSPFITSMANEDIGCEDYEISKMLIKENQDLPKKKAIKNDCDEELFIDGNSGWGRLCDGDD